MKFNECRSPAGTNVLTSSHTGKTPNFYSIIVHLTITKIRGRCLILCASLSNGATEWQLTVVSSQVHCQPHVDNASHGDRLMTYVCSMYVCIYWAFHRSGQHTTCRSRLNCLSQHQQQQQQLRYTSGAASSVCFVHCVAWLRAGSSPTASAPPGRAEGQNAFNRSTAVLDTTCDLLRYHYSYVHKINCTFSEAGHNTGS